MDAMHSQDRQEIRRQLGWDLVKNEQRFAGFAACHLSVAGTKPAGVDTAKVDDLPGKDRR